MEKIHVLVGWSGKNFGASVDDERIGGVVAVTAKTYEELQSKMREALEFHVEGVVEDGMDIPSWLVAGDYELEWELELSAMIRICEAYTSMTAIARAAGMDARQLSHYANGLKRPRPQQRQCVIDGIHKIGRSLLMV